MLEKGKLLRADSEINLQTLNDEKFAGVCHALLFEVHGLSYRPVAGEGGDSGIDGFVDDYGIIYQFKFFKARPRPASFLKDIDKVAHLPNLKQWILLLPEDPTLKLHHLIDAEKVSRPFSVEALGRTWMLSMLEKHKHIKERFFPEVAKEASVQKVIHLSEAKAKKQERILRELKREVRSKRPIKVSVEKPSDSLTAEHRRLIKDEMAKIEEATKKRHSFSRLCSNLKNKYGVDNWYLISDSCFPEIMEWLRRYYFGTRENYRAPGNIRKELIGVIKSQQKRLDLSDKQYRMVLSRLTGKTSCTQMDNDELRGVRDYFNGLLASNH